MHLTPIEILAAFLVFAAATVIRDEMRRKAKVNSFRSTCDRPSVDIVDEETGNVKIIKPLIDWEVNGWA